MKYCLGTVCWGGYLERYIDIFVSNYTILFKRLIAFGVDYADIVDPRVCYNDDTPGPAVEKAIADIKSATGKTLKLVHDKHSYTVDEVMYSTRNRLRLEYKKAFPHEKKVFFYFPIDDRIRMEAALELFKLGKATEPSACMFKFLVTEGLNKKYTAATRPITTYKDIHDGDWGGYCAYNIIDEDCCPLYPEISIPNVAFYAELYRAGYKEYASTDVCVDHLRHPDSHHYKFKDTVMSTKVSDFLAKQKESLAKDGYK